LNVRSFFALLQPHRRIQPPFPPAPNPTGSPPRGGIGTILSPPSPRSGAPAGTPPGFFNKFPPCSSPPTAMLPPVCQIRKLPPFSTFLFTGSHRSLKNSPEKSRIFRWLVPQSAGMDRIPECRRDGNTRGGFYSEFCVAVLWGPRPPPTSPFLTGGKNNPPWEC